MHTVRLLLVAIAGLALGHQPNTDHGSFRLLRWPKYHMQESKSNKHVPNHQEHRSNRHRHGSSNHVQEPSHQMRGPSSHVEGSSYHVQGPKVHVQGPKKHVQGFKKHVRGPKKHVQGPLSHVQGPSHHVKRHKHHVQGPYSLSGQDLRSGWRRRGPAGQGAGTQPAQCAAGTFLDRGHGACVPCSRCPVNEIIRRTCSPHRDTVCGPFYEFRARHGPAPSDLAPRHPATRGAHRPEDAAQVRPSDTHPVYNDSQNKNMSSAETSESEDKGEVGVSVGRWRAACYGLTAGLALVGLLAALYWTLTCRNRARRAQHTDFECRMGKSSRTLVVTSGPPNTSDYKKPGEGMWYHLVSGGYSWRNRDTQTQTLEMVHLHSPPQGAERQDQPNVYN